VPTNARKRKRPCVKKYCLHCIKTFYNNQYLDDNSSGSFICPACNDECRCAACRRRVMKARLKNDGSALENEADGQANSILESQTPDATNIEEGQVNGLLEILDSRPDVQDIIRRGMAMDFADDNAKILYVGHLIDQALTRPDVLALYYASSHGRANNCRIKTEADTSKESKDSELPPDIGGSTSNHNGHSNSRSKRNGAASNRNGRGSSSSPSSGNHRSSRRKKRNHQEATRNDEGGGTERDRKRKGKKQKYADPPEWNAPNAPSGMEMGHLPPPSAVKQEPQPAMMGHIHSGQWPPNHSNHNHHHHPLPPPHHSPQSKSNGAAPLMMNGISAPQPATMSLSGGNPMSFVNPLSFGGVGAPPHLGGLPLQFPPPHSGPLPHAVMDDGHRPNGSNPHHSPLAMAPGPPPNAPSEQTSNDADSAQNGNMFPMNVTPSVMAGGPPLASM